MKHIDVIVVGGGHAGLEAVAAVSRLGRTAALITLSRDDLGTLSCNPAIGGIGKGHLVREVDAFDGLIGTLGDAAAIQYRLLNRSKGPAVQGPRVQTDRALYRRAAAAAVEAMAGVTLIEGEAVDLVTTGGRVSGLTLADGTVLSAGAVVLATGTFLGGTIHIGDWKRAAGRWEGKAAAPLALKLREMGIVTGRLKTGTPPRLDGRTIAWDDLPSQPGDARPVFLSTVTQRLANRQIACGVSATNERTHDIIRANIHRSAMYGGHIDGVGPRYCPSIEDKVTRFADKTSHQVFLEPEGLGDISVYPNGISTSLPADVQLDYVRTLAGCAKVDILRPGYAVEYDYIDPRVLGRDLQLTSLPGLFLAGQINGTTGYEEAAAQGLVAGINAAAAAAGTEALMLHRHEAYIGVMIDDLITRGVTEPYRMFTSRAEYRLTLRADNADQRLTAKARALGCVGEERWAAFSAKRDALQSRIAELKGLQLGAAALASVGMPASGRSAWSVLSAPGGRRALSDLGVTTPEGDDPIVDQAQTEALYVPYMIRQEREIDRFRANASAPLNDSNFDRIPGLSNELREKLTRLKPRTVADAERIEGMTPAALALLLLHRDGAKTA